MSRIPEVPQGRQTLFVRLARWIAKRRLKRDIGPMKVMSHHPGVMFGTAMMETALERSRLVPQRIKALAEIQAARLIGCPFWVDIGSAVGRAHGVTDEQLLSLDEVEKSAAFAAPERLAIRLAVAMTRQPVEVPDALFAELRGAFSDAQIVELASAIAWENYRARFNHTFGLEAEGFMENAVCVLPPPAPSAAAQVAES